MRPDGIPSAATEDPAMKRHLALCFAAGMGLFAAMPAFAANPASADKPMASQEADATYADIEKTFGSVPTFFRNVPQAALPGAWKTMKEFQLGSGTALSAKEKELIGLAVAAQIPCQYCIYFHTRSARAAGASDEEIREAVAMSANTRFWSTILNGTEVDYDDFRKEFDAMGKEAK
jgi:AhpD family alkylhydroperoxidase